MDKYTILGILGDGTFGTVYKARNRFTEEIVAIKRIKKECISWQEGISLNEVRITMRLKHPNIVSINEVIRENNTFYFVMEYMSNNLLDYMESIKRRKTFLSEDRIKGIMYQVFQGLAYMHKQGVFHRDIKPENLLMKDNCVKIADFGLARYMSSHPPFTDYVSTRWYRAPELLLRSKCYDSAIDLWAAGCIMAELLSLRPLFPGDDERGELYQICKVLGYPTEISWKEGLLLAKQIHFLFPRNFDSNRLYLKFPYASKEAVDLLGKLLTWDPKQRLTAVKVLQEPFFTSAYHPYGY